MVDNYGGPGMSQWRMVIVYTQECVILNAYSLHTGQKQDILVSTARKY